MSPATVVRAFLMYLFLVFVTRIVGRRPGKQITPFEFVLVFYLGGLCLTAMVGLEASLTNAFVQIMCLALAHYCVTRARHRWPGAARLLDGTPLILLEGKTWRAETMRRMRIGDADVMNMGRDQGLKTLDDIDTATLERNGEISIIPTGDDEEDDAKDDAMKHEQEGKEGNRNAPRPVGDTVPKVDNAVAVGEDLAFQRKWWRFENIAWAFFALIILADLLGLLGNGPLAHTHRSTPDGLLTIKYDRIVRETTPNEMTVEPAAGAMQNGRLLLFVGDSMFKELGVQRVAPQPAVSAPGKGGITYLFPVTEAPATIRFGMMPTTLGLHTVRIGLVQGQTIDTRVLVLP